MHTEIPKKPRAKAKVRDLHERGIQGFLEWQRENPFTTHGETFAAFDRFIDSAEINEIMDDAA